MLPIIMLVLHVVGVATSITHVCLSRRKKNINTQMQVTIAIEDAAKILEVYNNIESVISKLPKEDK